MLNDNFLSLLTPTQSTPHAKDEGLKAAESKESKRLETNRTALVPGKNLSFPGHTYTERTTPHYSISQSQA